MMKNFKLHVFISILILLSGMSCEKSKEKTITEIESDETVITKIDSIAQGFIDDKKVVGISIAILKNGTTFYNKGFGYVDSARTRPVEIDNIFLMGSISKLIGSTIVMKLVEEGKLSLDNTLDELLPDYPNKEQAKKIKLHHLISHTSGLPEYSKVMDSIYVKTGKEPARKEYFDFFEQTPSLYEPGEGFCYNNSGFVLMAMIVENITDNTYQNEIDRIINKPLGLSIKLIREAINNPKTIEFFELKDTIFKPMPHWTWIKGDGGLTTTTIELLQFQKSWTNGAIISRDSYYKMIAPRTLNNDLKTGYGLGVRTGEFGGQHIIGRTGGHKTRWAQMVYFPKKDMSLAVFVNTDNTPANAGEIANMISLALLDKDVPDFKTNEIVINDLAQYKGIYKRYKNDDHRAKIYLNKEDNHLYYSFSNSHSKGEKMYYAGNNSFWIERWPKDKLVFVKKDSTIVAFKEYYGGFFFELRQKYNTP